MRRSSLRSKVKLDFHQKVDQIEIEIVEKENKFHLKLCKRPFEDLLREDRQIINQINKEKKQEKKVLPKTSSSQTNRENRRESRKSVALIRQSRRMP